MFKNSLLVLAVCVACACAYPLPIEKDEFDSVLTSGIDPYFYKVASEVGTDKVWDHRYDYVYSRWLSPVRKEHLRVLEIGLGCNMGYGAGKSLAMWKKYLPNTKVSYLEYDAPCAKKHKEDIEAQAGGTLYIGDQADVTLLNRIVNDAKDFNGFDLIIDDGGHTSNQMMTSIKTLWNALKPGGVYLVEDTSENYIEKPFRDPSTFMEFAKYAIDITQCRMKPAYLEPDSVIRDEFKEFCASTDMDIVSVECAPELCTFVKGKPRVRGMPDGKARSVKNWFGNYESQMSTSHHEQQQQQKPVTKRHHLRHNSGN